MTHKSGRAILGQRRALPPIETRREAESGNPAARSMNDIARDWISGARGRLRKADAAHAVSGLAAHVHDLVAKFAPHTHICFTSAATYEKPRAEALGSNAAPLLPPKHT